jgi:hypothetical protein
MRVFASAFFFAVIFCITFRSNIAISAVDSRTIELQADILEQLKVSNALQVSEIQNRVLYGSPNLGHIIDYSSKEADKVLRQVCPLALTRINSCESESGQSDPKRDCYGSSPSSGDKSFQETPSKDALNVCEKEITQNFSSFYYLELNNPGSIERTVYRSFPSYFDGNGIFNPQYTFGKSRKELFNKAKEAIVAEVIKKLYEKNFPADP